MKESFSHVHVISSGKYTPDTIVTNQDLEKIVDTSDDWIVSRTGISTRRKAVDESSVDMAYKAALSAINAVGYDKNKIDLIVVATVTPEMMTPSTANMVHSKLGIDHPVMSFDVNAACTGFVYALDIVASLLEHHSFRSALVIGSEQLTKVVDYTDRNTCVLFGDGSGALLLEKSDEKENGCFFYNDSTGDDQQILTVDETIKMDGRKVYQFAIDVMEKSILKVLRKAGLTIDDIDKIIPHQANERIIASVAKSMDIPMEKFFMNVAKYGNMSSASIPVALDEYRQEKTKAKERVLLVGFGGGFTWGSAILTV